MSDWKMQLYQRFPPFMRTATASLRGYQLRYWRYGRDTERLVAEALERDSWSPAQRRIFQENQLGRVLHRAATRVPFYRQQWEERRRRGDRSSWEIIENWPILKQSTLREHPLAFLADDCDPRAMYVDNTSGTTGTPLKVYYRREILHRWFALFEARWRRWYGLSVKENWALLGGQPVVPADTKRPPFWVWNAAMNQLYLSINHISRSNAADYVRALQDYGVTHLIVYASSATFLGEQILRLPSRPEFPKLKAILTNAEPLFDWQREILSKAFGCPVHETYGLSEVVIAASTDLTRRLRVWPEPGITEVLDDTEDRRLEAGQVGRLVCTSLLNLDMPLIRYEVGDRSGFSSESPSADDPIQNPILLPIQGRNNDMLIARDGRRVFWVNPIFYGLPVMEAQVVQESLKHVRVRIVASQTFEDAAKKEIETRLVSRMGQIAVTVEQVEQIPRGPGGKFRAVICNLSPEERESLSAR